jgi:hypothetical protein
MRHSCEAGNDHAEGHPVGEANTWYLGRIGLNRAREQWQELWASIRELVYGVFRAFYGGYYVFFAARDARDTYFCFLFFFVPLLPIPCHPVRLVSGRIPVCPITVSSLPLYISMAVYLPSLTSMWPEPTQQRTHPEFTRPIREGGAI